MMKIILKCGKNIYEITVTPAAKDPGTVDIPGENVDVLTNIAYYEPGGMDRPSVDKIETITGTVLGVVSNIGIVASVLIIAILGIKYMLGSVEEKAEYKKDLVPYIVGAFILFGITTILKVIEALGNSI